MFLTPMGNLWRFWRLSGLRQAFVLTAVFLGLIAAAGALAFWEFSSEFDDRIETELRLRFNAIRSEIEMQGVDPETYTSSPTERVALVPSGHRARMGFSHHVPVNWGRAPRGFGGDDWRYLSGAANDQVLVVGTNLGRRDIFLDVMVQSLQFVGTGAAFIALLFGVFFGIRTQRRLNAVTTALERAGSGDMAARVGAQRNRDDLDALAHQVDDTLDQLDVLMRQARDFSANIAHDLKTPLARLRIRLEKALTVEVEEGDSAEEIGAALEQADKVIAIFDAFLRIAKLESGAAVATFSTVDLGQVARDMAEVYAVVIEDSGRHFSIEITDPGHVRGDKVLLSQMVANMIENALRHTPEGTELTLIARGQELGLADTGPGIPEDQYDQITKPLYRLEKSRTTEGAGLGLALVKTIASLHEADLIFSLHPDLKDRGLYVRAVFTERSTRSKT